MTKYRKRGAQPVKEFRSEMHAQQRDGETCVDLWHRIKRKPQGLDAMHDEQLKLWTKLML